MNSTRFSLPKYISLALAVSLQSCTPDMIVFVDLPLEPLYRHVFVTASFYLITEVLQMLGRNSSPLVL